MGSKVFHIYGCLFVKNTKNKVSACFKILPACSGFPIATCDSSFVPKAAYAVILKIVPIIARHNCCTLKKIDQ